MCVCEREHTAKFAPNHLPTPLQPTHLLLQALGGVGEVAHVAEDEERGDELARHGQVQLGAVCVCVCRYIKTHVEETEAAYAREPTQHNYLSS